MEATIHHISSLSIASDPTDVGSTDTDITVDDVPVITADLTSKQTYQDLYFTYSHLRKDYMVELIKRRGFKCYSKLNAEEKIKLLINSHNWEPF